MRANARPIKYLLYWLIVGTRGGPTRLKIIDALNQSSLNANQLAAVLKISYKTTKGHLEILEKNKIVIGSVDSGGITTYILSQTMQDNYAVFEKLLKKVDENKTDESKNRQKRLQDNAYVKEIPTENRLKRYELAQSGKDFLDEQTKIREKCVHSHKKASNNHQQPTTQRNTTNPKVATCTIPKVATKKFSKNNPKKTI